MRKLSLLLFLFVLLPSSGRAQSPVESEEYTVYNAIISRMIEKQRGQPVDLVLIRDETAINGSKLTSPDWKLRPQGIYGVTKDTLDDYVAKNNQQQRLERLFEFKVKYELVDEKEHLKKRWSDLRSKGARTPGVISFSRVGFKR